MKIELLIDTLFLSLFSGFGGVMWLLYQQVPMSVPHQFLTVPLVIIFGAGLLYVASEHLAHLLVSMLRGVLQIGDHLQRAGTGERFQERRRSNRGLPRTASGVRIQERRHAMMR
ncbi:hypothetical protein [Aestuariirhabdus sp. LZHN29]|uniref:hypothetical protein n=1 Tax=Aestuariirhabdus sp. LZHN29 TaxID=3417462 RepID=UPI003CEAC55A